MGTAARRTLRLLPLVVGIAAALLYCNFLLDWVLRGFQGAGDVVSDLEAPGEPNALLLRVTDVVCAVLVVWLVALVRPALPRGVWREVFVWSTVLFAVGATAAAVVSEPCGPGVTCDAPHHVLRSDVHVGVSILSDTALYVGVFAVAVLIRRSGPAWLRRTAWVLLVFGGVVSSLAFGYFNSTQDPQWAVGATQRVHIVCIAAWLFCLGLFAARHDPSSDTAPGTTPERTDVTPTTAGTAAPDDERRAPR